MHEQAPVLKAQKRDRIGTRYARRLREAGRLPAVVYGHKREPVSVALEAREAISLITKGEKVFRLDFPGTTDKDEGQYVLLKDVQFDYLGTGIVHADFARVSLDERVATKVPLRFMGDAVGLKTAGAVMIHPLNEIEIECSVMMLPDWIEVNVSALDADQSLAAGSVKLPDPSMKLLTDPHAIVAQIKVQVEEKKAEETTVEGAAAAEPEVITAKKKEEAPAADAAKGEKKK